MSFMRSGVAACVRIKRINAGSSSLIEIVSGLDGGGGAHAVAGAAG